MKFSLFGYTVEISKQDRESVKLAKKLLKLSAAFDNGRPNKITLIKALRESNSDRIPLFEAKRQVEELFEFDGVYSKPIIKK